MLRELSILCWLLILFSGSTAFAEWKVETIVPKGANGSIGNRLIAIDSFDIPHVAFWGSNPGPYPGFNYAMKVGGQWNVQSVDKSSAFSGEYASLALSTSGVPHVAYSVLDSYGMHWESAKRTGATWSIQELNYGNSEGQYITLALDGEDNPNVAFRSSRKLAYAELTASARTRTIVTGYPDEHEGEYNSIALDVLGRPHISSYSSSRKDLQLASWTGTTWQVQTVDSQGDVGKETSLAIDENGRMFVAYSGNSSLKLALFDGAAWNISTIADVIGWTYCSLVLDSQGRPCIAYNDGDSVSYAQWDGDSWSFTELGERGMEVSLALDSEDNPHIIYMNGQGVLRYAVPEPHVSVLLVLCGGFMRIRRRSRDGV
jgi:hypothetical protein